MTSKKYIEVIIPCDEDQKEVLMAIIGNEGYDSMQETESGINAYILEDLFQKDFIDDLADQFYLEKSKIRWDVLEEKNWNLEWEKNFEQIIINDQCLIRAPFHEPGNGKYPYELVILPKMSFGTGHHATTSLMIKHQINSLDHKNKRVLDAGCGTAILAVLAEKLGAQNVVAYDIDDWSIENAPENVILNDGKKIEILKGTIATLDFNGKFDIILANINKNVLLEEITYYVRQLSGSGYLLMSGFYIEDIADLDNAALSLDLQKVVQDTKDRWACVLYKK